MAMWDVSPEEPTGDSPVSLLHMNPGLIIVNQDQGNPLACQEVGMFPKGDPQPVYPRERQFNLEQEFQPPSIAKSLVAT